MKPNSIFNSPRKRFDKKNGIDLAEVMAYTGDNLETATEKAQNAVRAVKDEWEKVNPQTPDEMDKFYKETEGYIYDLYCWPHDNKMWELFDKKITGEETVLDYGCGICDVSIYLAEKGCNVIAADIPGSKTLQFGMWRVYNRGLGDKIKFTFNHETKFDVVLAVDVLEHVNWPLRYIIRLTRQLREQNSWFFCTPHFFNEGGHPMHLKENFWLTPQIFGQAMVSLAFKPEQIVKEFYPIWYPFYLPPPNQVEATESPK